MMLLPNSWFGGIAHDPAASRMTQRHRTWPSGIAHEPAASRMMRWPRRRRSCAWCSGVAHDGESLVDNAAASRMWQSVFEPQTRQSASATPCGLCWILEKPVLWIRIGFNADPDPVFISMRILVQIKGAKQMQTHVDPDPAPGQTWESQTKSKFFTWKIT